MSASYLRPITPPWDSRPRFSAFVFRFVHRHHIASTPCWYADLLPVSLAYNERIVAPALTQHAQTIARRANLEGPDNRTWNIVAPPFVLVRVVCYIEWNIILRVHLFVSKRCLAPSYYPRNCNCTKHQLVAVSWAENFPLRVRKSSQRARVPVTNYGNISGCLLDGS